MAMKSLIEGECGGANPLMKFANHFTQDGRNLPTHLAEGRNQLVPFHRSKQIEQASGEELAEEFISSSHHNIAPSTFNMQDLLHQIHQPQQLLHQIHQSQQLLHPPMQPFQLQHSSQHQYQPLLAPQHNLMQPLEHAYQHQITLDQAGDWAKEYKAQPIISLDHEWTRDFRTHREGLFEDVYNNSLTLNTHPTIQVDSNMNEDDRLMPVHNADMQKGFVSADQWADELRESGQENVWRDMDEEWKRFTDSWKEEEKWSDNFQNFTLDDTYKEYKFEEANPLRMDGAEALNEGIKRMNEGDVANAVLFLETAVKQDSSNAMAWLHLGTSQADNEQEPLAIAAFNKCLELEPGNLKALLSLAVGYTNEGFPTKAYELLLRWISTNDKYKSFVQSRPAFEVNQAGHSGVLELFLGAVQLDGETIDADLQTCLGIIFNLSAEHHKAIDCFRTALQVSPQDSMLWNKLGATMANGQMSEQSIGAYRNALSLRPGYVRTRFNLGVACINLGAYRESIEHFLSALKLQRESKGPIDNNQAPQQPPSSGPSSSPSSSFFLSTMSSNVWQSLRLSLSLLGRHDLVESCDTYSLGRLLQEFNV